MGKIEFLGRGKRSIAYLTRENGKRVVIKRERADARVQNFLANEAKWLRLLNKKCIGPKLIRSEKDYIAYRYVDGERIIGWMKKARRGAIKKALRKILEQCRTMDILKVNKEEMHNPYKHILIGKAVKMIDFERCKKTEKPKNVTQFCNFITSKKITDILSKKGFAISSKGLLSALKSYKKSLSKEDFKKILKTLGLYSSSESRWGRLE